MTSILYPQYIGTCCVMVCGVILCDTLSCVLFLDQVGVQDWSHVQSYVPVCCDRLSDWSDARHLFSAAATSFPDGRTLCYRYVILFLVFLLHVLGLGLSLLPSVGW